MQLDINQLRALLPGRPLHYFPTTTSTMAEAARLAATGAPSGTVILAEKQTSGRGRLGRAWYSEANAGLYMTLILRPVHAVPWLTLAVGLALRDALAPLVPSAALLDIRWPNDVLLGGRKCSGILVTTDGDSTLVGIGVNVNQGEFPAELADLATSLRSVTGKTQSREDLLISLLGKLDNYLQLSAEEIRKRFTEASSYVDGLRVEIEDTGATGVTCGLDAEGFLLLRKKDGTVERIVAGGVRPAPGA